MDAPKAVFPPAATRRSVLRVSGTMSVLAVGALALAGCGGQPTSTGASSESEKISVVTSTNVYADLVQRVGAHAVTVKPVITSGAQDPHSYEASAQDRLAVDQAHMVVINGGGYDAFMDPMVKAETPVLDAVEISGMGPEDDHKETTGQSDKDHADHRHGEFNEHVWYDIPSMIKLVEEIAQQLGEIDSEHAQDYTANAEALAKDLQDLDTKLTSTKTSGDYLATEPMPSYLLESAGLSDVTPAEFTEAIDAEADIPPAIMQSALELVTSNKVDLLAVNQQTATGQTAQLRTRAQDAGVPVVEFSETIPDGQNYITWMRENINHIQNAIAK